MPDGKHSKEKLNVRVPPQKKQEWKDHLEDGESLTSLVQRAVDREVRDEYVPQQALDELQSEGSSEIDFTEITTRLEDLQSTVTALQNQIDEQSTVESQYSEKEVSAVAMQAYQHVPDYTDVSTSESPPDADIDLDDGPIDESDIEVTWGVDEDSELADTPAYSKGTAERIAHVLDEDVPLVRKSLIYLENETTEDVFSVIMDSTRYWVRK